MRELRNETARVIAAVESGERVVLTVRGQAVADIVPHAQRSRWRWGESVRERLSEVAADPELRAVLDDLVGRDLDNL